jgi:dTDP-4-dehydrorhamnose 3,5-epimerase
MKLEETGIDGCFLGFFDKYRDKIGEFVKSYNSELFKEHSLENQFSEDFYSINKKGVIRGLHFQIPPADQVKVVHVQRGEIFDVIVDLRKNSKTYGVAKSFTLKKSLNSFLYLPRGIKHGFLSLSNNSIVCYKVSEGYNYKLDKGILYNSIDVQWPILNPIVSDRDLNFISFDKFKSPF